MDDITKKALEGSIKKWENIVNMKEGDNGSINCPLCTEFIDDDCEGCPVGEATGDYCVNKEYDNWKKHHREVHRRVELPSTPHKKCPECKELAQKELDFLISLREK